MRTETMEIYKFEELDKNIQQKVIEKNYDINVNYYDWWDSTQEDFYRILDILGYYDIKSYFSGFHSQGDGASFQANWNYNKNMMKLIKEYAPLDYELQDIAKILTDLSRRNFYKLSAKIIQTGYYCHEFTMYVDYVEKFNGTEPTQDSEDIFKECSRRLARWYYSQLNNDYDFLTSEDSIVDTIIANEYEFYADGEMI